MHFGSHEESFELLRRAEMAIVVPGVKLLGCFKQQEVLEWKQSGSEIDMTNLFKNAVLSLCMLRKFTPRNVKFVFLCLHLWFGAVAFHIAIFARKPGFHNKLMCAKHSQSFDNFVMALQRAALEMFTILQEINDYDSLAGRDDNIQLNFLLC